VSDSKRFRSPVEYNEAEGTFSIKLSVGVNWTLDDTLENWPSVKEQLVKRFTDLLRVKAGEFGGNLRFELDRFERYDLPKIRTDYE